MKRFLLCIFFAFSFLGLAGCDNVPAGYVGVKVDKYGDSKGVGIEVRTPGRYAPTWNTEQFLFPTYTQNFIWDVKPPTDDSFSFQDKDGASLSADVGVTYHITTDNAVKVFQKYRRGVEEITNVYLRAMIRDSFNMLSSDYAADELYGNKKDDFMKKINIDVKARAVESGVTVESVYLVGAVRLPATIQDSVNNKIRATQIAIQKENELQATRADGEKEIVKARAEAEATRIRGEALKQSPQALQQLALEKWNGALPMYMNEVPSFFVNVNK